MFRKRWYVLAVGAACLILCWSAVNIPWLSEFVVGKVLRASPGIRVEHVHIERQQFSLPGRLELQGVDLGLKINGKSFSLKAPQVMLTGLQTMLSSDRRMRVTAEGVTARYDLGQAKEAKADLTMLLSPNHSTDPDRDGVSGPLTAVEVNWDKLRAKDVSVFLIVNKSGVELRAMKLTAYKGKITGKTFIQTAPVKQAGIYTVELLLEGLDVAQLAEVNPEIAVQLNGLVTGTVKLVGDPRSLRTVDTDLVMPLGGKMSASLLGALTQYLPQSREKQRLDLLIRKGGKIVMEAFSLTMKGGEAGKFSGDVRLKSREVNLELNLTHEINTDGTIDSLLGYWGRLLQ
jgi:hypothetical protein